MVKRKWGSCQEDDGSAGAVEKRNMPILLHLISVPWS
jgi:hypothetical protein